MSRHRKPRRELTQDERTLWDQTLKELGPLSNDNIFGIRWRFRQLLKEAGLGGRKPRPRSKAN